MADKVTTTNVVNSTQLPQWYQDYLTNVMGRADAAADEPYQAYTGPTVAGLSPQQQQAYDAVSRMQGGARPWLNAGTDMTNEASGVDSGAAASGAFGNANSAFGAASIDSGAAGAGMYGSAADIYGRVAGSDTAGISSPYVQQGTGYLQQSTEGSALQQANPYIQQSVAPTGLAAAQPWLNAAGTSFTGSVDDYMSPYTDSVVNRIGELGGRNLTENILPGISDTFIRAGGYGSPQQRDTIGRAIRDTQEATLAQQNAALESGYKTAGELYNQDASRYAGLAGTAGGLGTAQQQALLGAGQAAGSLSSADLSRLAEAGVNIGNLGIAQAGVAGADYTRQLGAGQGLQGIGASQIQAAQADAGRQLDIGRSQIDMGQTQVQAAQADATRRLAGGQQMANIGQMGQTMNLQQIAALESAGAAQQAQTQKSYDAAQKQYQEQQNYPWQQIGNLSNVIQGLPVNTSSAATTQTTTPGPSTAAQLGGLAVGAAGLVNSGVFKAKGGPVLKKRAKHSYGSMRHRGIASLMEAA